MASNTTIQGINTRKSIVQFIIEYIKEHGYSPSVREIAEGVGLKSTSSLHAHLTRLFRSGSLETDTESCSPRSIRVPGYEYVRKGKWKDKNIGKVDTTKHPYYCETYESFKPMLNEFGTWEEFKTVFYLGEWDKTASDFNFLFRYDIKKCDDTDSDANGTKLILHFMRQRHGRYNPVIIKNITDADMPEVTEWLGLQWEYMQKMWHEFSGVE